jgi:hypothetical protein
VATQEGICLWLGFNWMVLGIFASSGTLAIPTRLVPYYHEFISSFISFNKNYDISAILTRKSIFLHAL